MSLLDAWNRWRAARNRNNAAARAEAFWLWFASAANGMGTVIRSDGSSGDESPELAACIAELNRRTAAYHPTLRAVVGVAADRYELVLTPEGDPAGATHARDLARAAPQVPGWSIRAFKPLVPMTGCVVQVGSVVLTPDDVEFAVIDLQNPDIGQVTLLLLFIPGLDGPQESQVRIAADQLIQAVVGEERALRWKGHYVMEDRQRPAEKVANIDRQPLPQISGILEQLDGQLGAPDVGAVPDS